MKVLSFGLGVWALAAVVRGIGVAESLATGSARDPASVWVEAAIWLAPALVAGLAAVITVSRPSSELDTYLARNVRMGVMVALFAVVLAWTLVIYAAYLQLVGRG